MKRIFAVVAALIVVGVIVVVMLALNNRNGNGDTAMNPTESTPVGKTVTTSDGLQITDETIGTGATAQVGSTITVKYTGTLDDGTVFDSTEKQGGQPATFQLAQGSLIQGWVEGIPGMKVGGKRKLVIPAALAYGDQAQGAIPANSQLTFEIELDAVQ